MISPLTNVICSKCGCSEEYGAARQAGWLIAQRDGQPEGHLIIRCPEHVSQHARRLAGLPQQDRTAKVAENLERGLYVEVGEQVVAAHSDDEGGYWLQFHEAGFRPHASQEYPTLPALIDAMRAIEPDLRRWRLTEA
jgi:hypothetical protein